MSFEVKGLTFEDPKFQIGDIVGVPEVRVEEGIVVGIIYFFEEVDNVAGIDYKVAFEFDGIWDYDTFSEEYIET